MGAGQKGKKRMLIIYLVILFLAVAVFFLSRKARPPEGCGEDSLTRYFNRPAFFCYRLLYEKKKKPPFVSASVKKQLEILMPEQDEEERILFYGTQKLAAVLLFVVTGAFLGTVFSLPEIFSQPVTQLERQESGGGKKEVVLGVTIGESDSESLTVTVDERKLTDSEFEEMLTYTKDKLDTLVLGENESAQAVTGDLYLPAAVPGSPFRIQWESSNYQLVDGEGKLKTEEIPEEGEMVVLTAVLTCGERKGVYSFQAHVYPGEKGEEQIRKEALLEEVRKAADGSETLSYQPLPEQMDGEKLIFQEQKEHNSVYFFLLPVALAMVMFVQKDRELAKKMEQRNRKLLLSYPAFISRLVLLMGTGLPVRPSCYRLVSLYQERKRQGEGEKEVYELLTKACMEMEGGTAEMQAYEQFGKRCGLMRYRKCVSLINQNLRKGTDGLLDALLREAQEAFEEQKAEAKKLGEEAQTKLLLPMILMLLIIMIMILVPACFSFGGI